jgi:O-acetyl-ADP-ribose deacetylase (regulator of RNase III)
MDEGWSGPPFDPVALAERLGLRVIASDDIRDARIIADGASTRIEFNPNRPRARTRYSIAHEIAHTLFPDFAEQVRHRATYHELSGDEWQLEALCNIAAAEIIMPIGTLPSAPVKDLTIEGLMDLRAKFEVSAESLLLRVVQASDEPCLMFCASRLEAGPNAGRYQLDYTVASPAWRRPLIAREQLLPPATVLAECTAIGYTAKANELWVEGGDETRVQCVGVPPYPGASFPRVVGLLSHAEGDGDNGELVRYVRGSVTDVEDRAKGPAIVVHVVNDATANWGGSGVAMAIMRRWPEAQDSFRAWAQNRSRFALGAVHFSDVGEEIHIATIVGQAGYGISSRPRVRYAALRDGLDAIRRFAVDRSASVHMPRIGCGQAGGKWEVVHDIIASTLSEHQVPVTIYDLPDRRASSPAQKGLFS